MTVFEKYFENKFRKGDKKELTLFMMLHVYLVRCLLNRFNFSVYLVFALFIF